jgi:hypothetical protein
MKYGFTGTQEGMTDYQKAGLILLVRNGHPKEFHHGDCIGSDEQAVEIVNMLGEEWLAAGLSAPLVISHPSKNPIKRAYAQSFETRKPQEYLDRNHDIVDEVDILIAAPYTIMEVMRSGTWATVRYAWSKAMPVAILFPIDRR